ncbi:hypothetical protein D3C85_1216370 [compost metagenome]
MAKNTAVSAPCAGVKKNGRTIASTAFPNPVSRSTPMFVATAPGWSELAVAEVPASRFASSRVNKIFASFDWAYPFQTRNPRCR